MNSQLAQDRTDWAGSIGSYLLAWGLPSLIIVAGFFTDAQTRTILWNGALAWKGSACVLNAHRCGRTHCRFTGPFYLVLIVPVLLHGYGVLPLGPFGWWILGTVILLGGILIWWATETVWGKFSVSVSGSKAR